MPLGADRLVEHLSNVKPSTETIQSLSRMMLLHKKRPQQAIDAWSKAVAKARPEQAMWLLWVANDAMQRAHAKSASAMVEALRKALPLVLDRIALEDNASVPKAQRVLGVLSERGVIDKACGDALLQQLTSRVAEADKAVSDVPYIGQARFSVPEDDLQGTALPDHEGVLALASAAYCEAAVRALRERIDDLRGRLHPLTARPESVQSSEDDAVVAAREAVPLLSGLVAAARARTKQWSRSAKRARAAIEEERGKVERDRAALGRCSDALDSLAELRAQAEGAEEVVRYSVPMAEGEAAVGGAGQRGAAAAVSAPPPAADDPGDTFFEAPLAADDWEVPGALQRLDAHVRVEDDDDDDGGALSAALRSGLQGQGDEGDEALASELARGEDARRKRDASGAAAPPAKRRRGPGGGGAGEEGEGGDGDGDGDGDEDGDEVPMVWSMEKGRMVPATDL